MLSCAFSESFPLKQWATTACTVRSCASKTEATETCGHLQKKQHNSTDMFLSIPHSLPQMMPPHLSHLFKQRRPLLSPLLSTLSSALELRAVSSTWRMNERPRPGHGHDSKAFCDLVTVVPPWSHGEPTGDWDELGSRTRSFAVAMVARR